MIDGIAGSQAVDFFNSTNSEASVARDNYNFFEDMRRKKNAIQGG